MKHPHWGPNMWETILYTTMVPPRSCNLLALSQRQSLMVMVMEAAFKCLKISDQTIHFAGDFPAIYFGLTSLTGVNEGINGGSNGLVRGVSHWNLHLLWRFPEILRSPWWIKLGNSEWWSPLTSIFFKGWNYEPKGWGGEHPVIFLGTKELRRCSPREGKKNIR